MGPSSLERSGPMRILRFTPLLAVAAAACLIAWTPQGHSPPPEVATLDRALVSRLDRAPPETASITSGPKSLRPTPPLDTASAPSASPETAPGRDLPSPSRVTAPSTEAVRSDKEAKVQFAYASLEGTAPALGAPSAVTPPAETASLEPSAPPPPATPEPAADPALPPPRSPQAVILYRKGDATGLMALASAATDADERSALEWTALRADAHPSFDSLVTFLKAHPGWPSRVWIRDQEEAELATHPQALGQ